MHLAGRLFGYFARANSRLEVERGLSRKLDRPRFHF